MRRTHICGEQDREVEMGGGWSAGSSLKNRSISRCINTDGEGKKENKAKVPVREKCIC